MNAAVQRVFELIDAGDAAGLRELFARDPSSAAAHDEEDLSVVMRAAYRGGEVFEAVLAAGPPLGPFDRIVAGKDDGLPAADAWTPDGFTGLHLAAFVGNVDAARALLGAGADPNTISRASFAQVTPLGTAAFRGSVEVARVLLEHGAYLDLGERRGDAAPGGRSERQRRSRRASGRSWRRFGRLADEGQARERPVVVRLELLHQRRLANVAGDGQQRPDALPCGVERDGVVALQPTESRVRGRVAAGLTVGRVVGVTRPEGAQRRVQLLLRLGRPHRPPLPGTPPAG